MTTLTVTTIATGCCGSAFIMFRADSMEHGAFCGGCRRVVNVAADVAPYMDAGEVLVPTTSGRGWPVLGYVTREGE